MNETFSLKRFGTYFKFDITRLWRKHSKAVMLMGFSGVVLYVLVVLFNLVFNQQYSGPGFFGRLAVFMLSLLAVELYQTRFYGYITDKKDGSDWILLPASKGEKFVSMLINTLIVIPCAFLFTYLFTDWLICLLDKSVGEAIITGAADAFNSLFAGEGVVEMENVGFTMGNVILFSTVGAFANYLYFLLCGICFKKNKIFYAIAIMFGLSTILSILSAFLIPFIDFENMMMNMDEAQAVAFVKGMMTASFILSLVLACGLGWGVWHRISTIKH